MRTEERLRKSLRNFKNSERNTRTNPQGNAQAEIGFFNVNQNNDSERFGENLSQNINHSHNLRESIEVAETKSNFKDTEAKMNTEEDSKSEQEKEENVEICCQI
jgi:hypothetical protein